MTSLLLLVATVAFQAVITQPPAQELLDDQGFAEALAELEKSPRVRLETIGRSHKGRPVVLIIVGEPEVMENLDIHRGRAQDISGPRVEHPTTVSAKRDWSPSGASSTKAAPTWVSAGVVRSWPERTISA